jgi:hypothetical protein
MAGKESGLGWTTFSVDDASSAQQALVNDTNSLQFATPRAVIDTTGMDKFAHERILGLADFSMTAKGTYDDDANKSHQVFKTIALSTSPARLVTIVVSGQTLAVTCLLTDYALDRSDAGELSWSVPGALSSGTVPTWS